MTNRKTVLMRWFFVSLIYGLVAFLISRVAPNFLLGAGFIWLLITIILIVHTNSASAEAKKYLTISIVACVFIALTYSACFQSCRRKIEKKLNSETIAQAQSGNSVKILTGLSQVQKTSWGRLVKFTGRDPDGVIGYETTKATKYSIRLIGGPGITDNNQGEKLPIWGADGFAKGWEQYFLYPEVATPNSVLIVFGIPGDARIKNVHKFSKGKTELIVQSPGNVPLVLYYHEANIVNQDGEYPYFQNNHGYFTFEVEEIS